MSIEPAVELARFQEFIAGQLNQGVQVSPEEALDLWRANNPSPDEFANDVLAIREALADLDAGDLGTPLEEFDRLFRQRHTLSPNRQSNEQSLRSRAG